MSAVVRRCRADENGDLVIALGRAEAGHEVVVTVQPADEAPSAPQPSPEEKMSDDEWRRAMEKLAGSIDDPEFKRPSQPELPERNWHHD